MGIYVCDRCGCIENTALGSYWVKDMEDMFDPKGLKKGEALCSECSPSHFIDGTPTRWGKWHGRFPKVKWDGKEEVMNRKLEVNTT
jgi:hypothetical protein